MALYDLYAEYRDPVLNDEERSMLEEAQAESARMAAMEDLKDCRIPGGYDTPDGFVPDPVVATHIGIAMDRADSQFQGHPPMPEDLDVSIRFPGVDPVGKYSVIDMKFAQRQAALEATLQTRPPEVQAYVRSLQAASKRQPEFMQVSEALTAAAKRHRTLTRASKLCLDGDGRRLLHQQARAMETDTPVVQYDLLLQGMEYAAGVKTGPLPRDVSDFYAAQLHTPIPSAILAQAGNYEYHPQQLSVEFQNFEHRTLHGQFAAPRNWGKPPQAMDPELADVETLASIIPPYAAATADRVLSPAFEAGEKAGLSRADLLLVDGMSVRERMEMEGLAEPTPQQIRERSAEYVACALMAGKRVEAYVPDKDGTLPAQPTQITKTGYEPSPMKKVTLNAWERFFSKRGFYKEKAAKADEYKRVMDARARVAARFDGKMAQPLTPEQVQRQAAALAGREASAGRYAQIVQAMGTIQDSRQRLSRALFGDLTANPLPHTNEIRTNRTSHINFCLSRLAEEGHPLADIMDPGKLQQEKAKIGAEFRAHAEAGDVNWYMDHMISASTALMDQMDKEAARMSRAGAFTDESKFLREFPTMAAASLAVFDIGQEINNSSNKPLMRTVLDRAAEDALYTRSNNVCAFFDSHMRAYRGQINLHDQNFPIMRDGQIDQSALKVILCSTMAADYSRQDMAQRLSSMETPRLDCQDFVAYGGLEVHLAADQKLSDLADGVTSLDRLQRLGDAVTAGKLNQKLSLQVAQAPNARLPGGVELRPTVAAAVPAKEQKDPKLQQAPKSPQMGGPRR